jgi:hypothetical protein
MRYLEKTQYSGTAGWFNPETFQIYVSGYFGSGLSNDQKQVLRHELFHYLHFTSTTLGVAFITKNFKELNSICEWKFGQSLTDSKITEIHKEVIRINRYKAKLAVPSYYFLKGPMYDKLISPNNWKVGTSVGSFFKSNSQKSDQNFIMHRFTVGEIQNHDDLVARVSLGTKYLYEHLIKFIDMMVDMERDGIAEAYQDHYDNAYFGPLLPYSALALVCARYNVKGIEAFILSSILSHLTLMVPMNWTKKTMGLKSYIEKYIRKEIGKPNYSFKSSHPSVVVEGFLIKALEIGTQQKINYMEFFDDTNDYEKLNNFLELICNQFSFSTEDLFESYESELKRLERTEVYYKLRPLKHKICEEIKINLEIKKKSFGKYIMQPHATKYSPFVQMDNHIIPGNLTSHEERDLLNFLIEQRDEMLRFDFERNIIE